ncbi:MAG: 2Fe-2S iron-sulfur cluster binding domain-containing protein [Comamonadaceae bacterium]|nr:MAG: 2Fe-2S iron-sulfur cluster binding domain-containing protein [Comamonadaceae bacterium]
MKAEVAFNVNGRPTVSEVDTRTTLLDLLREQLRLTGAKKGCDHGQCGACTVMVDGRRSLSCLRLAVTLEGRSVTTVEGIGTADALHPVQAAFVRHDALQCGFCTPGQIMSAVEVVADPCATSRCAIRELMSGNLCRCGAYPHIVAAIEEVRAHGAI